ncbi:MAG TPA: Re/Si-specific NAD(P)(+) transhydrogenase subunit alpha [Planctomycetes bacterium]|nr:Re/Si-specific NAD(P)(+) transhydrogenase subunit alpha [Planctomycetota bacterium]HIK60572.1 Re/Si-specific NAD(P)(+) transhydrogenase subunit alpha [Planctomycetota bacterium]
MRVGVPKEVAPESRVAAVPEVLAKFKRAGLELLVESGAGEASGFSDEDYRKKGASVGTREEALACPIVLAVEPPATESLSKDSILICMPDPLGQAPRIAELARQGVTCFAMELMPRISRAQSMDVLSSMANVAGYKAVLLAAAQLPKLFPLMMTAAGTVRPAKVFVLGAGVAGLQAIATARRLGAIVEGYDIRSDTKEQVESLGARFVEFDLGLGDMQDEGGYAKELTDEQKTLQAKLMAEAIQSSDCVITTAQVPGRRAPLLIPAEVVEGMKSGSVIVDMAADSGGNCALSEPGQEVVAHGVTIIGTSNLPGTVAQSCSTLYANNLITFLAELVDDEGQPNLDMENEVIAGPLACHQGEVTHSRILEILS